MKNARQVFLIRHPKPDIASGICYGSSDVSPEPIALKQAFEWLDTYLPRDAQIITSPLARCAQLASKLSAQVQRRCTFDARLAERHCGAWELQPWDQVPRVELDAWAADFMDYSAPGAESVRQLQTRVLTAWQELIEEGTQQAIVLITHAGPIQVILAHLTGAPIRTTPVVEIVCGAIVVLNQKTDNATRWDFRVATSASHN